MENVLQRLSDIWGEDLAVTRRAFDWIQGCVSREQEEDLYLDFKRKQNPKIATVEKADRATLAQAISGFANTDGGLIVWGVDARVGQKGEPDVARDHFPILGLKEFVTGLNSNCGSLVTPPLAGIENLAIPFPEDDSSGFVITVIPRRRDTPCQAAAGKYNGQFFMRSGSDFFQLPETILAELYRRRPTPLLALRIDLDEANTATVDEQLIYGEEWQPIAPRTGVNKKWYGRCEFQQNLSAGWRAVLMNHGLGTAREIAITITVTGAASLNCLRAAAPRLVKEYEMPTVVVPARETDVVYDTVQGQTASVHVPFNLHPGQEVVIAKGSISIPAEAFGTNVGSLVVSGKACAEDSPVGSLKCSIEGDTLSSMFGPVFKEKALPSVREIPKPPSFFDEDV